MSDLTAFRDHARKMSTARHKPICDKELIGWRRRAELWRWYGHPDPGEQPKPCHGCVTDDDRALWARLADEADAYLNRNAEEGLFDETPAVERDSGPRTIESETKRGPDRANESDPLATVSTTAKGA